MDIPTRRAFLARLTAAGAVAVTGTAVAALGDGMPDEREIPANAEVFYSESHLYVVLDGRALKIPFGRINEARRKWTMKHMPRV
ncbi:MAG TPA: hypothetical protein VFG76_11625 [Candidatus Polarisedimenticolia bacterium]|nr:hypothetical protein [Candidatus Polarisedimenticolia bacterium]